MKRPVVSYSISTRAGRSTRVQTMAEVASTSPDWTPWVNVGRAEARTIAGMARPDASAAPLAAIRRRRLIVNGWGMAFRSPARRTRVEVRRSMQRRVEGRMTYLWRSFAAGRRGQPFAAENLSASAAATAGGTKPETSPPSRAISFTSREAIAW